MPAGAIMNPDQRYHSRRHTTMETTHTTAAHDHLPADDEMLFLCPDRETTGFQPSSR